MPARTGKELLAGLRDDREVWLEGRRVTDVTEHPAFAGGVQTMADLYDLQHDEADVCLVDHPTTGERTNVSHVFPRSRHDLLRLHAGLDRTAPFNAGMLGRSPAY